MRFLKSEAEREAEARAEAERIERDRNVERRFEYHVFRIGSKARAEEELNELGRRGWQLVQVVNMDDHLAFYLERELPDSEEAAAPADEISAAVDELE